MSFLQDGFMKSIEPFVDICFVFLKDKGNKLEKYHKIFREFSNKIGISCATYKKDILVMGTDLSASGCYRSGYGKIGEGYEQDKYFAGMANSRIA